LKRSGRYEARMLEILKARKLPEDLVYLSLVESGMNPRITSHAGAAGLWQFMPKAAEAYGLRMDKYVDERLDPQRSTEAAARFLEDLHTRFGRWELAMAAYNMGHGGLLTSIRKYNTNDFWELSQLEAGVPFETALYVPKIVAIAFVARNRELFGCADLQLDPAEKFDVSAAPPARAPGKLESVAAPKSTVLAAKVPATAALAPPVEVAPVDVEKRTLRWGESLEYVAATIGTTESRLRALNGLTNPVPPRPGTTILVPKSNTRPAVLDQPVAVIPARTSTITGKKRVFYEVVWGDELSDVARALGVTADDLCHWNNLDASANLHGKMVLQAFVPADRSLSDVRTIASDEARVLVVGSPEFFEHFESKNGRVRSTITVQSGDTMQSLAKKFGLSVGMMERINHRSRDGELKSGETLVVYARKAAGSSPAATSPAKAPVDSIYDGEESKLDG
jgi:membrane-bound lytic murein transglycosylase D